jgi:hypothetical protein
MKVQPTQRDSLPAQFQPYWQYRKLLSHSSRLRPVTESEELVMGSEDPVLGCSRHSVSICTSLLIMAHPQFIVLTCPSDYGNDHNHSSGSLS